jgi:hypothetical protein
MIRSYKITALLLFGAIYACSDSPESTLRKNTEAHLMSTLNDASSYEFVSIDDLKTITIADTLILHLEYNLMPLRKSMYDLKELRSEIRSILHESIEARNAYTADSIAYVEIRDKIEELIERSESQESKQTIVGYKSTFKYRANNSNGAKQLREMMIYSDLNYNLLDRYIKIIP